MQKKIIFFPMSFSFLSDSCILWIIWSNFVVFLIALTPFKDLEKITNLFHLDFSMNFNDFIIA